MPAAALQHPSAAGDKPGQWMCNHLKSMGVTNVPTRRSHLCTLPLSSRTTVLAG